MACNNIWSDIMQDGIVTEDEAQKFSKYLLVCEHLTPKEVKYWNGKIELNRTLYDITVTINYQSMIKMMSRSYIRTARYFIIQHTQI